MKYLRRTTLVFTNVMMLFYLIIDISVSMVNEIKSYLTDESNSRSM